MKKSGAPMRIQVLAIAWEVFISEDGIRVWIDMPPASDLCEGNIIARLGEWNGLGGFKKGR
jgi:hypothetical protein